MPHGDFSDKASFTCWVLGISSLVAPTTIWYGSVGPLKPMFDGEPTVESLATIRMIGGLLLFMAPVLFMVRWNTLNGKAGMIGCFTAAGVAGYNALAMDEFAFVLRGWWLLVAFFILTALHLGFNANPMLTSAMLLEKEAARAAKAKAK